MSKLQPCPFCGGEGCVQRHDFVGYTDTFGVVCLDCGCETRQFYDTEKDATEAWNRRANRPQGRWLFDRYDTRGINRCSECGAEIKGYGKNIPFPNCPYCLARMERSEQ